MRDTKLGALIRLREQAVDEAKAALAECLKKEAEAAQSAAAAERAISDEAVAATALEADDAAVEAFAAWLPTGRRRVEQARTSELWASAETDRARAALALSRAALEAAQTLQAERDAERAAELARRDQIALDDIARQTVSAES